MQLLTSVLSGMSGALIGLLWSSLVSVPWLARVNGARASGVMTPAEHFIGLGLFGACGAVLGLLFWLGWGLVALIDWPWPALGLVFGVLGWAALVLPLLAWMSLRQLGARAEAAIFAVEWLVACVAAGMFCAMAWDRMAA